MSTKRIVDETPADDKKFINAHIVTIKENLTNCHNQLQIVYGQLNEERRKNKELENEIESLKAIIIAHESRI